MQFNVVNDNVLKIVLTSKVDVDDLEKIANSIKEGYLYDSKGSYVDFKNINCIKLDLKNVGYLYSKHLSWLINIKKICSINKIKLTLINVSDELMQLFTIADLTTYFTFEEDYTSYNTRELVNFFYDPEKANLMVDYLSKNYTEDVKEEIHRLVKCDDPILKEYAILTAGKAYDYGLVDEIRKALEDEAIPVVTTSALVVGWLNDIKSKDILYKLIESDVYDIVEAAVTSIALMPEKGDAERISFLFKNEDHRIRAVVAYALGLINDDESYLILLQQYRNEKNPFVRSNILKALTFFKKDELKDVFVEALNDKTVEVQEVAASALMRVKAYDKIDILLEKLKKSENTWAKYYIVKTLAELAFDGRVLVEDHDYYNKSIECLNSLIDIFNDQPLHVKLVFVQTFAKAIQYLDNAKNMLLEKDKEKIDTLKYNIYNFLKELIKDENEDIRKEALEVFFSISSQEAEKEAVGLLENDPSWIVRLKAAQILGSIPQNPYKDMLKMHMKKEKNKYVIGEIREILND
ncbi:MAG: HEAT repeat domain-containing protein [Deferribacterota bacterium]|nr:HEAT repeat domain-containing protein [Deferribacterota bacterium]